MFIEKETEHGKIRKKRTNSIRIHPHPIFRKTEKTAPGREESDGQKRIGYRKTSRG